MTAKNRPGQTLIEVVMATMISAMTTTAVFSVILSSFVSDAKADKRDAAAMVLKQAQETLKSYISADPYNSNVFGTWPPQPGSAGSPAGRWTADASGTWALNGPPCPGMRVHDISSLVSAKPPLYTPGLPTPTLTYSVCSYNCIPLVGMGLAAQGYPTACKQVVFTLTYPE